MPQPRRQQPPVTKPQPRRAAAIEVDTPDEPTPVFSGLAAHAKNARVNAAARMNLRRVPQPAPPIQEEEVDNEAEVEADSEPEFEPQVAPPAMPLRPTAHAAAPDTRTTAQAASPLTVRKIGLADCDNLWDWIRQDADRGAAFLGVAAHSSVEVHAFMRQLLDREAHGLALARCVDYNDQHIGFAVLLPILEAQKVALTHFYLSPATRGHITQLLPGLLQHASQLRPDLRLVIVSDRPEWARLLAPHGFRQQIVLIRD